MTNEIIIEIVSNETLKNIRKSVYAVILPTNNGERLILNNHRNSIYELIDGDIKILKNNKDILEKIHISSAIVNVEKNLIFILTNKFN